MSIKTDAPAEEALTALLLSAYPESLALTRIAEGWRIVGLGEVIREEAKAWHGELLSDVAKLSELGSEVLLHGANGLVLRGQSVISGTSRWLLVSRDGIPAEHVNQLAIQGLSSQGRAVETREELLARVSHELRTPMNATLGMLELLREAGLEAPLSEYIERGRSSALALLTTLDALMSGAKIQSGDIELSEIRFALHRIVDGVVRDLGEQANARGIAYKLFIDPGLPRAVAGDPERVREVLVHLIRNAIKFTDFGEVVVRVDVLKSSASSSVKTRISISDTGIGIPEDSFEHIFEPFTQMDVSTQRRHGGAGLGLSLSRSFVRAMGGEISVKSEVGVGSTFAVELTFRVADPMPWYGEPVAAASRRRIALPRSVPHRAYFLAVLESRGHEIVDSIVTPESAQLFDASFVAPNTEPLGERRGNLREIDIIRAPQAITPLKVIEELEDGTAISPTIAPPPPDAGLEHKTVLVVDDHEDNLLIAERALEPLGCRVLLARDGHVALAVAEAEHIDLILMDIEMPGMNGFQTTRAIQDAASARGGLLPPIVALSAHATADYPKRCRQAGMSDYASKPIRPAALRDFVRPWLEEVSPIIIVDDLRSNRMLLAAMASRAGRFAVYLARHGLEAVELMQRVAPVGVWMDLDMPVMNGFDAAGVIRRMHGEEIPLIALSAHDEDDLRALAESSGFLEYLTKPITLTAFQNSLRTYCAGALWPSSDEKSVAPPTPKATQEKAEEGEVVVPDSDIADLAKRFLERRREDMDSLRTLAEERNFEELRRLGHNLKGSGRSYGFGRLSDFGATLEKAARSQDALSCEGAVEAIAAYLKQVRLQMPEEQ